MAEQEFKSFRELTGVVDVSSLQQREATLLGITDKDWEALRNLVDGEEAQVLDLEPCIALFMRSERHRRGHLHVHANDP